MKKLLILTLISSFFLVGFAQKKSTPTSAKKGYEIKVTINNSNYKQCYLAYYFGKNKYIKDTAEVIKPGEFIFKGEDSIPGGIYIVFFPNKKNFEIIVNEQQFSFETDTVDFVKNFKSKDSKENTLFFAYLNFIADLQKQIIPIQNEFKSLTSDSTIDNSNNERVKELRKQLVDFEKQISDYRDKIIEENPTLLISKNFKAMLEPEIPETPILENGRPDSTFNYRWLKEHYFDNIDFSDDRILRTPIFEDKLKTFIQKMVVQVPDSVIKEADKLMQKASTNKEMFKFTCITVTNIYGKTKIMGLDEVFVHMIENYYNTGQAFWADSADLYRLKDRAQTIKYTLIGRKAPNIMMKDTSDVNQTLYGISKADYNIVIFWDPDCGHCKKELPKLKKVYDEIKNKYSIQIITITTSILKDKWMDFIRKNKMGEWINLYDPDYQSPFRQLYDITSTPKMYMLDKDKIMIAKMLGMEQIEDFLEKKEKLKKYKTDK